MKNSIRPTAVEVTPLEDYHLLVVFDNGEQKVFDCHELIKGEFYGKLNDPAVFKTVHIAGLSIAWADGQDVCPDELYDESIPLNDFLNRNLRLVDLMAAPYKVEFTKDPYEGGYAISFPELSGCLACGDTMEQAVINAFDVKRKWLEDAMAQDSPIRQPTGENKEYESTTKAIFVPKPGYYGYYANLQDAKEETRREICERGMPIYIKEAFEQGEDKETVIKKASDAFGCSEDEAATYVEEYIEKRNGNE